MPGQPGRRPRPLPGRLPPSGSSSTAGGRRTTTSSPPLRSSPLPPLSLLFLLLLLTPPPPSPPRAPAPPPPPPPSPSPPPTPRCPASAPTVSPLRGRSFIWTGGGRDAPSHKPRPARGSTGGRSGPWPRPRVRRTRPQGFATEDRIEEPCPPDLQRTAPAIDSRGQWPSGTELHPPEGRAALWRTGAGLRSSQSPTSPWATSS